MIYAPPSRPLERVFRKHSANLNRAPDGAEVCVIAFDGKTLKGSFDNFNDAKAKQKLLSRAFCSTNLTLYIQLALGDVSISSPMLRDNELLDAERSVANIVAKLQLNSASAPDASPSANDGPVSEQRGLN